VKHVLATCAALTCGPAFATPVEDMIARGFACDTASETQLICRKHGQPTKLCNSEGSCFRIIYEAGLTRADPRKTGSVADYAGFRK
jgi:hypothetical protein